MSSSDYNLLTFKAICTFTNDLSEIFAQQNHSLKLYQRLINKTTLNHDKAITKHIDAFKNFCVSNRDAIITKTISKLAVTKVEYSPRVFIDFASIFRSSDKETTEVIWKHLLTISAFVDPAARAKEILKKSASGNEGDFLTNIINKVEQNVNPNAQNPLEAVTQIMQSGVFTELLTGMNDGLQNGSLDLGKLMGSVQTMCNGLAPGGISGESGGLPGGFDMASMLNTLSGAVSGGAPGMPGTPPGAGGLDMASMLSSLSGAVGGNGNVDINNLMASMMPKPQVRETTIIEPSIEPSTEMETRE